MAQFPCAFGVATGTGAQLSCSAGSHDGVSRLRLRVSRVRRRRVARNRCPSTMNGRQNESSDALQSSLAALRSSPIVLCVRMENPDVAFAAASAAIEGGLRCIEITLTTPDAFRVIRELSGTFPSAHVGAGTVLSLAEADSAAKAGARFALSPVVDVDLIRHCNEKGMLAVPGAATPTEIHTAYAAGGAHLVKIFPVNMFGGVEYVRALAGPLGHIPLLPTSGIGLESVNEYLELKNVAAVGASRQIFTREALASHDWSAITQNARKWAERASPAKSLSP